MQSPLFSLLSILDKLRVMTRDGSGSEGEYLWLGLSAVWAWEWLRPQRCSAFFPVDCLFGGENQSTSPEQSSCQPATQSVIQAKYLLFLKIQMFGLRLPGAE